MARILYVDTEPVWRGGQEQLFGLMAGMKSKGHDVCLVSPKCSPLHKRAAAIGIRTNHFRQRSELSPLAFFRILRQLRKGRFDVLHLNTPKTIIAGGLAAQLMAVKGVVSSRRVNFPLRSRLSALKYNLFADKVLTVSVSIRDTLIQGGVGKEIVDVVYEGVDLDWIDSLVPSAAVGGNQGPAICTVAHLSSEKGHVDLLQSIPFVIESSPNAKFYIVGDGPLKEELSELAKQLTIQNNVVFLGFREDSEALMKQFDIFCLPSLSEGLSSAILAAMANGLPVVATDVGGIPELVVHGETGYLVPPNDPLELAGALKSLIENEELRLSMGKAGRVRISERFTVGQKLDSTEAIYTQLLQESAIR